MDFMKADHGTASDIMRIQRPVEKLHVPPYWHVLYDSTSVHDVSRKSTYQRRESSSSIRVPMRRSDAP